jgi:hypothetical protein
MNKTLVLALIALVSATGAAAAGPAPAAADSEKKICKTERVTGSRTRTQRICLTEAQWRELAANTKRGVDELAAARTGGGQTQGN